MNPLRNFEDVGAVLLWRSSNGGCDVMVRFVGAWKIDGHLEIHLINPGGVIVATDNWADLEPCPCLKCRFYEVYHDGAGQMLPLCHKLGQPAPTNSIFITSDFIAAQGGICKLAEAK